MLTVLQLGHDLYLALLRAPDGTVARFTGPPDWVLEQLALAMESGRSADAPEPEAT